MITITHPRIRIKRPIDITFLKIMITITHPRIRIKRPIDITFLKPIPISEVKYRPIT